jgi:hypothetical protein
LGDNAQVDRISVFWPSGTVQHMKGITADQILHLIEAPANKQ